MANCFKCKNYDEGGCKVGYQLNNKTYEEIECEGYSVEKFMDSIHEALGLGKMNLFIDDEYYGELDCDITVFDKLGNSFIIDHKKFWMYQTGHKYGISKVTIGDKEIICEPKLELNLDMKRQATA